MRTDEVAARTFHAARGGRPFLALAPRHGKKLSVSAVGRTILGLGSLPSGSPPRVTAAVPIAYQWTGCILHPTGELRSAALWIQNLNGAAWLVEDFAACEVKTCGNSTAISSELRLHRGMDNGRGRYSLAG